MTPFLWRKLRAKSQNRSSFFCVAAKVKHSPFYQFKETRSPLGGSRGFPPAENRVFNMQKLMFLRWRRHRSRKSAISKIPSYINPAQNTKPKNTCWRRLPAAPIPAMPQPWPFSKAKSVCFRMSSNSRIKPRGPRPRAPKTRSQKHVLEATPTAPLPQCHSPARFSVAKNVGFRMHSSSESKPELRGTGPRLQGTGSRLQGSMGRSHRPQGPSSELQNLVPTAWAHAGYQNFIKSLWTIARSAERFFGLWLQSRGEKPIVSSTHLQATATDFL